MQINAVTFSNENRASFAQSGNNFINSSDKAKEPQPPPVRGSNSDASQNIEKIKAVLQEHNISLQFSTDPTTNAVVVKMVDEKTGEAIRQFPTEVSLRLAANFQKLQGHFINATE